MNKDFLKINKRGGGGGEKLITLKNIVISLYFARSRESLENPIINNCEAPHYLRGYPSPDTSLLNSPASVEMSGRLEEDITYIQVSLVHFFNLCYMMNKQNFIEYIY